MSFKIPSDNEGYNYLYFIGVQLLAQISCHQHPTFNSNSGFRRIEIDLAQELRPLSFAKIYQGWALASGALGRMQKQHED
jgi:hypothetical protein